jgi:hypothetical protein
MILGLLQGRRRAADLLLYASGSKEAIEDVSGVGLRQHEEP